MDVERTMQFILETQSRVESTARMHDERLGRIEGLVEANTKLVEANTTRIGQLVEVCLSLAHAQEETNQRMQEGFRELREIQAAGEYKLNALINAVDKLVQRNGGAPQP